MRRFSPESIFPQLEPPRLRTIFLLKNRLGIQGVIPTPSSFESKIFGRTGNLGVTPLADKISKIVFDCLCYWVEKMKVFPLANKQTRLVWKWVRAAVVEASSRKLFRGNHWFASTNQPWPWRKCHCVKDKDKDEDTNNNINIANNNKRPTLTLIKVSMFLFPTRKMFFIFPAQFPHRQWPATSIHALSNKDINWVFVSLSSSYLGMWFSSVCLFWG